MGKLAETSNLLELFTYMAGKSEVPKRYFHWMGIGMIAAAMGPRCGYYKLPEERLLPNLYIMLIGPSAIGKGVAINKAVSMLTAAEACKDYEGRVTAPALLTFLANHCTEQREAGIARPHADLLFITEELAAEVGSGERAQELIKILTKLYTSSGKDRTIREMTRMHGENAIERPCVSWFAGSTAEWFRHAITYDAIQSGFFSRMLCIMEGYNNLRIAKPAFPPDYYEVKEHLLARLKAIKGLAGDFEMTEQADAIRTHWYENFDYPADELMHSWWKRADDLLIKLAMVESVADGYDLVINEHHIGRAMKMVHDVGDHLQDVIALSQETDDMKGLERVRFIIASQKVIGHSQLVRAAHSRQLTAGDVRRHLEHLVEEGVVVVFDEMRREKRDARLPGKWYAYKKPLIMRDVQAEPSDGEETT